MNNDRELLELAAKAAGIKGWVNGIRLVFERSNAFDKDWNPLGDDGDAFRLAVQLNIFALLSFDDELSKISWGDYEFYKFDEVRRIIVTIAARIGQAMP